MNIVAVADALQPAGLAQPILNVLAPDANNYTALLLQPKGVIDATDTSINNRDRGLATAQFGMFLKDATTSHADLVVTPEYSVPWDVLKNAITGRNAGPAHSKLWALGCESIRYSELLQLQTELRDANIAKVIFEPLQADDAKFVDPLAYVFRTATTDGLASKLVILVQFKTHAMGGDPHDFERNHLQLGNAIYQFGDGLGIRLTSLICSDFLAFTDLQAAAVRDRGLILHLQLNEKRQHPGMRGFRERLLNHRGKSTEIVTLNWARDTRVYVDGNDTGFRKFAGSAWCIKADEVDLADATVALNHRKGMYYTWLSDHQTHTMFLNFAPASFSVTASKVDRSNVAGPAGNRRGPQLDSVKIWDAAGITWTPTASLEDGFAAVLPECGHASHRINAIYTECPLACERLVSLSSGNGAHRNDWQTVKQLGSFALKSEELILRFTFCQPVHPTSVAFRREHLRRCSHLWNALTDVARLPPFLQDVADGFELKWTSDQPHQNLQGSAGERATVIYLGESSPPEAESVHGAVRKRLHQSLPEDAEGQEHTPGSAFRAKQRIAVWYTDNVGQRHLYVRTPRIADAQEDPADIRRAS